MYFALANGGPAAWVWAYLVVGFGVLCQAITFGEMASIQPIAGAQYYWTWNFAPIRLRRFLTWIQGWSTWTGYIALLATCINGVAVVIEGIVQLNYDYEVRGWHTALIDIALILLCAGINIFTFRLLSLIQMLVAVLNIILLVIFMVVIWTLSPKNSSSILTVSEVASGWENYFVSANIGSLSSIFLFIGLYCEILPCPELRGWRRLIKTIYNQALKASSIWPKKHVMQNAWCRKQCSGLSLQTLSLASSW